jgi:hypothetical protein
MDEFFQALDNFPLLARGELREDVGKIDEPTIGAALDGWPTDLCDCIVVPTAHKEDTIRVENIAEQFFPLALTKFVDLNFLH